MPKAKVATYINLTWDENAIKTEKNDWATQLRAKVSQQWISMDFISLAQNEMKNQYTYSSEEFLRKFWLSKIMQPC